jgi:hypothetical protein
VLYVSHNHRATPSNYFSVFYPCCSLTGVLPPECVEFTVGNCKPNGQELLDSYPIANTVPNVKAVCQVYDIMD